MSLSIGYCTCGRKKRHFHHNCSESIIYESKYGCPYCDDECTYCRGV
ncbi:hypothetical protein LCGC14_0225340 [marine sediment metagenome]|uniref:Uncharacterized protein n=1 Tax=marine sediment metagenome TaxID=412755 RepID=A0A0F9UCP4_9ZZZZ